MKLLTKLALLIFILILSDIVLSWWLILVTKSCAEANPFGFNNFTVGFLLFGSVVVILSTIKLEDNKWLSLTFFLVCLWRAVIVLHNFFMLF